MFRTTTHQTYPYTGTVKSLVIGIDVGTTFSSVSYSLLEPGSVPRIQPVMRFSGQREVRSSSQARSVVCYDQNGNVIAAGPETDPGVNSSSLEIDGVKWAEWFKLRLQPPCLGPNDESWLQKIFFSPERGKNEGENHVKRKSPKPVTDDFKTPVQVFADFLQYLFRSAKEYIIETERNINPNFTWSAIESNVYFVLTHPNGWEGKQRLQMRDAAVTAGLVNASAATTHITFLTECEANLRFCLGRKPELRQEKGLLVVDCGGGTIDISSYSQTENGCFKENISPDCLLQGSIFVTTRARDYFKEKFKDSQFGSDDDVQAMAEAFDMPEGVKCLFHDPSRPYFVKFSGLRINDRKYGICGGKFKVEGAQMAQFFDAAVQSIIGGIENQCRNAKYDASIKHVLLVGGFARSQYLYARLCDYFKNGGIIILRPDISRLNTAVADGAVSWYLDRYVFSHCNRFVTHCLFNPPERTNYRHPNKMESDSEAQFRQSLIPIRQFATWSTVGKQSQTK